MTEMRVCKTCQRELPITRFHRHGSSKVTGLPYRNWECADCVAMRNETARERRVNAREMRTCTACNASKRTSEFYRRVDGSVDNRCKACTVAAQLERYHRLAEDPAFKERRAARKRAAMARRKAERMADLLARVKPEGR